MAGSSAIGRFSPPLTWSKRLLHQFSIESSTDPYFFFRDGLSSPPAHHPAPPPPLPPPPSLPPSNIQPSLHVKSWLLHTHSCRSKHRPQRFIARRALLAYCLAMLTKEALLLLLLLHALIATPCSGASEQPLRQVLSQPCSRLQKAAAGMRIEEVPPPPPSPYHPPIRS
jgi:hypothetical protein